MPKTGAWHNICVASSAALALQHPCQRSQWVWIAYVLLPFCSSAQATAGTLLLLLTYPERHVLHRDWMGQERREELSTANCTRLSWLMSEAVLLV